MDQQKMLEILWAKDQIRHKIYAYSRACDRVQRDLQNEVFWPEAQLDYGEALYQGGVDGFAEFSDNYHLTLCSGTHHAMANTYIIVEGNKAFSETYGLIALRSLVDEEGVLKEYTGRHRYIDEWECRDGEWKIIKRTHCKDFCDDRVITNSGEPAMSTRDNQDPSYIALNNVCK